MNFRIQKDGQFDFLSANKFGVAGGSASIPLGNERSDYLFWDETQKSYSVGTSSITIGAFAGQTGVSGLYNFFYMNK